MATPPFKLSIFWEITKSPLGREQENYASQMRVVYQISSATSYWKLE
jgi:hypothetical protein